MHILHIVSGYPTEYNSLGGIFFRDQILALSRAGVKEGIIFPELRGLRTFRFNALRKNYLQQTIGKDKDVPIFTWHGWNPLPVHYRMKLFVKVAMMLSQDYFQSYGIPSVIHAHNIGWAGIAAHRISCVYGVPFIITEHSSSHQYNAISSFDKEQFCRTFQDASKVMTVSSSLANVLEQCYEIPPPLVLPNVVDTEYFRLPPVPASDSIFRFCFVGNLIQSKNVALLLKAFALAFLQIDDVRLEIGGDGVLRTRLESLSQSLGIASKVRFLGSLNREEVRMVMWRSGVLVLPSDVETFGVVLIEAMATGLPVIATRCGGPDDFVTPDVGMLVEVGDIQGLADAMSLIYLTRQEYACRAIKIRDYAKEKFGERVLVERLLGVYKELAG